MTGASQERPGGQDRERGTDEAEAAAQEQHDERQEHLEDVLKAISDEISAHPRAHPWRPTFILAGNAFVGSNVQAGDVVAGSEDVGKAEGSHKGADKGRRRSRRIAERDMRLVQAVHVGPIQYRRAERILRDSHLVVLVGEAQRGKWTSALHLALSLDDEDLVEGVEEILSNTMQQLCGHAFDERIAYVVDGLDNAQALRRADVDDLHDRLIAEHSYLVVTIHADIPLGGDALRDYRVDWRELPDLSEALKLHLLEALKAKGRAHPAAEAEAAERVRDGRVQTALKEVRKPREIVDLAELLIGRWDEDLDETLDMRTVRVMEEVAQWFHEADLHQQSLMIALAVLDGSNYGTVAEKAEAFYGRIEAEVPLPPGTVLPTSLTTRERWRSERLQRLRADFVWGYEERPYGRNPVRLVKFRAETYTDRLLRHAWEEHDVLHQPLLDWLHDLACDRRERVREAAGAALGRLAMVDFDQVIAQAVEPWANDRDFSVREVVARALFQPFIAQDHATETQALQLLEHWSRQGTIPERWTAIAAYGSYIGYVYPHEAIQGLHQMLDARYWMLRRRLVRSVVDFFGVAVQHRLYQRLVLDALTGWTARENHPHVRTTAVLAFLSLTNLPGSWLEFADGPALLWLVREDEACRESTARLWLRALDERKTRRPALAELRRWFTASERQQVLQPPLQVLIERMAAEASEDEADRLRYHLEGWASDERTPSATAAVCLQAIE